MWSKKVPNTVLSGKLTVIDVSYQVTGTITIENDCVFNVKGFSINKAGDELKWYGAPANSNEGTLLSKDIVASPASTTDLSYNIENTDQFCHASLLDDVDIFRLMDKNFKLIAQATINKSSGNSGGSAPAQSGSAGASKPTGASGTGASTGASSAGASKPTGASGTGASTGAATAPAPAATNTIAGNNTASNPIKSGSTTSNKTSGAISLKAPSIALYIALFVLAFFRL